MRRGKQCCLSTSRSEPLDKVVESISKHSLTLRISDNPLLSGTFNCRIKRRQLAGFGPACTIYRSGEIWNVSSRKAIDHTCETLRLVLVLNSFWMIDVESFKGEWYVVIDTRYISLKFEDKFGFRLEKYFCVSFSWFLFFGNYLGEFGILENRCSESNFGLFIFSFMIWIKKVSYRKIKLGKLFFISLFIKEFNRNSSRND